MEIIPDIYDVLIVGAGLVGLATALGLHQRGIHNILVIDQTHNFRPVGQVLDLLPNGLKALKCIEPQAYEAITQAGMRFSSTNSTPDNQPKIPLEWVQKNTQGERISAFPLSFEYWFNQYGEGRVSIPWYKLQTHLRNLLPETKVKVNQGVNQGFEDALVLVTLLEKLAKNNDWNHLDKITQSFYTYEEFRRPFMAKIQQATIERSQWSETQLSEYNQDEILIKLSKSLKHRAINRVSLVLWLTPDSVPIKIFLIDCFLAIG